MWVLTTKGFFSAVQKPEDRKDDLVTVRARAKTDIDTLGEIVGATPYEISISDYPWRVKITKRQWTEFMVREIIELDYDNFKDEVKRKQGKKRAEVYSRIWGVLLALEPKTGRYASRWFSTDDDLDGYPGSGYTGTGTTFPDADPPLELLSGNDRDCLICGHPGCTQEACIEALLEIGLSTEANRKRKQRDEEIAAAKAKPLKRGNGRRGKARRG